MCCFTRVKTINNQTIDRCADPLESHGEFSREEICQEIKDRAANSAALYEILECQCGDDTTTYSIVGIVLVLGLCLIICLCYGVFKSLRNCICPKKKPEKLKTKVIRVTGKR